MFVAGIVQKIYNRIADTSAVEITTFIGILFAIIILEIIVGIFFFHNKKQKKEDEVKKEFKRNGLLCRFVLDGSGNKIGESIAVNDDIVIVKSGSKYLGFPLKHIEEEEKTLLVKGLVDLGKAEEMGEKWRKESFHEIDQTKAMDGKKDGI
jgi:hypothetical protein